MNIVKPALIIMFATILGIFFAAMEYILYEGGILIDEMVTGTITITDIMTITIVIWILVGVIFAVIKS